MKKTNKKGFTIVELVIVIAVIAILSAVLIPTFSGIVKKARLSADQQAVTQMNEELAAEASLKGGSIFTAYEVLAKADIDAEDYKALSKGMAFFWDSEINRVLMVEVETGEAVFPKDYIGRKNDKGNWYSLTQKIETEKPAADKYVAKADGTKEVTVNSGNQLAHVLDTIKNGNNDKVSEVKINGSVDMMGAAIDIKATSDVTISGGTIKNATAVDAYITHSNPIEGQDGFYGASLFPEVASKKTLTLKDVVFENVNIKDVNSSNAAILVGTLKGTLVLDNVTIKNSSVIGHHNVGALVGNAAGGTIIIKDGGVKIENVDVLAVGGTVGQVFGYCNTPKYTGSTGKITISNVTTGIYNCDANTGSYNGIALGLANGQITSTEVESSGEVTHKARVYFANTLIGKFANTSVTAEYEALKALIA